MQKSWTCINKVTNKTRQRHKQQWQETPSKKPEGKRTTKKKTSFERKNQNHGANFLCYLFILLRVITFKETTLETIMNQLIHQQAGELFPREWQDEKLQRSCEAKLEVRLFCNLKLRNQSYGLLKTTTIIINWWYSTTKKPDWTQRHRKKITHLFFPPRFKNRQ